MAINTPDPHAIAIARAVQERVAPDMVILFGSRATGRHHEHSDVDLLVVTDNDGPSSAGLNAYHINQDYLKVNPPRLEIGVIRMTRKDFDYYRRANQHIAGQAARYGVIMNGERLGPPPDYHDGYPEHWPETRRRIENAEKYNDTFNDLLDLNHWNQDAIGFLGQQAVENALKGWLSSYNDDRTFGHDLIPLWRDIQKIEDWSNLELGRVHEAVSGLFNLVEYEDPNRPGEECDWLTNYGVLYRYAGSSYHMSRQERLTLKEKVNNVVAAVVERIHAISGTTESDVYPEGIKPWDVTPE